MESIAEKSSSQPLKLITETEFESKIFDYGYPLVFATCTGSKFKSKPKKSEIGTIQNKFKNFKLDPLYAKRDETKNITQLLYLLQRGYPFKFFSWTGSEGTIGNIENYKCNMLFFDYDEGILTEEDRIQFEENARGVYHLFQRSSSWGIHEEEMKNGRLVKKKYRYHCFLILDEVITDQNIWEKIYRSLMKEHESKIGFIPDKSCADWTKLCFAGKPNGIFLNKLPLQSVSDVLKNLPKEDPKKKDPDPIRGRDRSNVIHLPSNINYELLKEVCEDLVRFDGHRDYDDWLKNIIFPFMHHHRKGKLTMDQLKELYEIIDDGSEEWKYKLAHELKNDPEDPRKIGSFITFCDNYGLGDKARKALMHVSDDGRIIPDPFYIKNNSLYKKVINKEGEEKEKDVSRFAPSILKEFSNIERNSVHYEIAWKNRGKEHREVIPASVIATKKDLLTLAEKGFSCNDKNQKDLIDYFDRYLAVNEIDQAQMVERLGHIKDHFIHPLNPKGIEIVPNDSGEKQLLEGFQVSGSVESWKTEVFDRIKQHPKVLFFTLASFASVILKDLNVDPFIVEIAGSTSQGKTTALHVSRSVHGTKQLRNEWHITKVALERKAGFLNSFPLFMDDTRKVQDERILQNIIYQFSGGRSKGRGSIKGSQMELTWNNILLSTGEVPITEYAKRAGGAAARVISLVDEPFKDVDAEYFNQLYNGLDANYGAVGLEFINRWEKEKKELIPEFHQFKQHYFEKSRGNEVLTRLSMYYATVHFAGRVLKQFFNIDVDLKSLDILYDEMARENQAIDKPRQLLEEILMKLDSNRKYIANDYTPDTIWAIVKDDTICFTPQFLKDELGTEERMIRKEWQKRGFTISHITKDGKETDYKKVKHRGSSYNAVVVNPDYFDQTGLNFETNYSSIPNN